MTLLPAKDGPFKAENASTKGNQNYPSWIVTGKRGYSLAGLMSRNEAIQLAEISNMNMNGSNNGAIETAREEGRMRGLDEAAALFARFNGQIVQEDILALKDKKP